MVSALDRWFLHPARAFYRLQRYRARLLDAPGLSTDGCIAARRVNWTLDRLPQPDQFDSPPAGLGLSHSAPRAGGVHFGHGFK